MEARSAWVLNLDADLELAASTPYAPTKTVRAAMTVMAARVAPSLLRKDDVLIDDGSGPGSARGLLGRAFCPTPRAIALLERAGAAIEPHPSVDVLRLVNGRSFAAGLGRSLPGSSFVTSRARAEAVLAHAPDGFEQWRVKRLHGMAGRRQRVIDPTRRSSGDEAFVVAGLEEGGVQIEPNVAIVAEYAKHGKISPSGQSLLGPLVRQRCDPRGAWIDSERVDGPTHEEDAIDERLATEASYVATALVAAGYFGPFGIDAFTYRDREGGTHLHPLSEINARYSMAFGLAFPP